MVDPELPDEFALEDRNDREISVRHQASGHVYLFRISGAELVSGPTIVPNPDSDVDAVSLEPAARSAALEHIEAASKTGPADDAADQVIIQAHVAQRRRFIDIINSEPSAGTIFGEARTQAAQNVQAVPAAAPLALSGTPPDTEVTITQQASGGSQFRLDESGRIDLVPDPPANTDERQQELYDELRRKTFDLSALNPNLLGDLSAPINVFLGALPENIEAVSITRLWSRGNTLRRRLGAHELAVGSDEPDPARLPPLVAGQLHDLVDTLNVFITAEPKGRELDEDRRGPQERDADRAIVSAFKPIVQALRASQDVATPPAVEALTEQNEAAQDALSASGVDSDQAVALAGKSDRNAAIGLLWSGDAWLRRGAADDVKSGFYRGIGNAAAKVAIGGAVVVSFAVAVFIANQAAALKGFVDVAFHDPALGRIIDAIAQAVSSMPPIGP